MPKHTAIYVRVSSRQQDTASQRPDLDGRSFQFPVFANSGADAIAIAKTTYGPRLRVFSAVPVNN